MWIAGSIVDSQPGYACGRSLNCSSPTGSGIVGGCHFLDGPFGAFNPIVDRLTEPTVLPWMHSCQPDCTGDWLIHGDQLAGRRAALAESA
jgi:hypothetical protein